jgi:PAS domain S-box-containing protein
MVRSMRDITRRAVSGDLEAIGSIAVRSGLFDPDGWAVVEPTIAGCLAGGSDGEVRLVERDGVPVGVSYVAPEPFAASAWNLYLLAVDASAQGAGIGSVLLRTVEAQAGAAAVGSLIIETSGVASFAATRAFYDAMGYRRVGRLRDFYGPGDDKVVYQKALNDQAEAEDHGGEVGLVVAGPDQRVSIWNAAAERLLGHRADEVTGALVSDLVPVEYRSHHDRGFAEAMAGMPSTGDAPSFHLPVLCADGTERVFAARFSVLRDPHGQPCGALVLVTGAREGAEAWSPVA